MKKIIILNLTRMGDIIQSTALFKKIKFFYPESVVTLIVSTEFYEITHFLPYIDEIRQVNLRGLTEILKFSNFEFNSAVYKEVNAMIPAQIKDIKYDLAINLSHDKFSVYFLYMLNSKKNIGISITREGNIVSNDKMIAYLFSAVKNRKASVLNLVDVYARCIDGLPENRNKYYTAGRNEIALSFNAATEDNEKTKVGDEEEIKFINNLKEYGLRPDKGDIIVSFAIGASMKSKKWHMDSFVKLARMLLAYNAKIKIVLLGAPYDIKNGCYIEKKIFETEAGKEFIKAKRLINLTGKTSVAGLAYTVAASKLLITHDTGTMHIGVGLHTDLIVIYTGHVGFMETGPYAENMVLVTPDISCFPCDFHIKCMNPVCKNLIKPEYIFDIAKAKLENRVAIKKYFSKYKNSGIIAYISRFDVNGFIDFLPAVKDRLTLKDLKLRILKLSLEYFYTRNFKLNLGADIGNNNYDYNNNDNIHHEIDLFIDSFNEFDDIFNAEHDVEAESAINGKLGADDELSAINDMLSLCAKGMNEAKNLVNIALNDPLNLKKIDKVMSDMKSIDYNLQCIASPYDELCLINYIHVINLNSTVSYDIFGMAVDSLKNYSGYKHQLIIFKKIWSLFFDKLAVININL